VVPLGTPAAAAREGETPAAPYVLYVGGIEPHKNAGLLVRAIAAAPVGVRLLMAGPWSRRRLDRLRRESARAGADGRVTWLGYLPAGRLSALRAGARAVLVPSRKEGFGLPVLEALAAGVPVIASDTPALREAGGSVVRYLPADDPAAWAGAIGEAAAGSGVGDAEAPARRAQAARFTWEETARRTLAAYAEAAG
jgi:glycosyltransferase involved in cell wall biosynthesis